MDTKVVTTVKAPAAIGPYSQGIAKGPLLFVSGQIGMVPETGEIVSPEFSEQARQTLENLRQVVLAGGCEIKDIAAVDVFLVDMNKFSEFNEIYGQYFHDHKPARAVVEVSGLPRDALVEVKCVAYCK